MALFSGTFKNQLFRLSLRPKEISNGPTIIHLAGSQGGAQTQGAYTGDQILIFLPQLPSRRYCFPPGYFSFQRSCAVLEPCCSTAQRRSVCPFAADTWGASAPDQGSQCCPLSWLTAELSSWYLLAIWPPHSIFYTLHTATRISPKMQIKSGYSWN